VDLDGTLIHTDLLVESSLALLAHNPLMLFVMPFWLLLGGKAKLKREIAQRIELNPTTLPYNQELVDWVREQQALRITALCTASDLGLAERIADHLGIFDIVIGSDGVRNLSGANKANALVEHYGERGFDYAGNAIVDLHVWRRAHAAIVVEAGSRLTAAATRVAAVERTFKTPPPFVFTLMGQSITAAPMDQKFTAVFADPCSTPCDGHTRCDGLHHSFLMLRTVRFQRLCH
jgi:hypothetical protein